MTFIKKWMKYDRKGTKYCAEADVYHFYNEIKPEIIFKRVKQLVKDHKLLDLLWNIIKNGVEIGIYCSQWLANVLLQPLDQLIHESKLCDHYLRYMDNFTFFCSSKRRLHKLITLINNWLGNFGLKLKGNWQVFRTKTRLPQALGYRYGYNFTLLRKRNLLRLKRNLSDYYKRVAKEKIVTFKYASGLISRLGQLSHCNSHDFFKYYYKRKTLHELKGYVIEEVIKWTTYSELSNEKKMKATLKI